jgi:hypothetical protein
MVVTDTRSNPRAGILMTTGRILVDAAFVFIAISPAANAGAAISLTLSLLLQLRLIAINPRIELVLL